MKYELITDYRELQPADQIAVQQSWGNLGKSLGVLYPVISDRPYYFHHGIYMGESKVVEFSGPNKANAKLFEISLGIPFVHIMLSRDRCFEWITAAPKYCYHIRQSKEPKI